MSTVDQSAQNISNSENSPIPSCVAPHELEHKESSESRTESSTFKAPPIGHVLLKLFFHSVAMFTLPFITYFGIKNYAENELDVQSPRSFIYGIIGAVIVVQLIIASYVYQAIKEERESRKKIS